MKKLFTLELGLDTISQKIQLQIMKVFIKTKEKDHVYPSEENVFVIISLTLVTKEYLIIKYFGEQ